jgi:hypothetical protein
VLRRLLGDNRREEIFVSTADLLKRLDGLPSHAREVFAPLQLGGEPVKPPVEQPAPPVRPAADVKPAPAAVEGIGPPVDRRFDTEPELSRPEPRPEVRPEARSESRPDVRPPTGRTLPPPAPMSEARGGLPRLSPPVPATDARRVARPTSPRDESPVVDQPMFEDQSPPFSASRADPTLPTAPRPSPVSEVRAAFAATRAVDKRPDDSALSDAIERALGDADDPSAPR